MANISIDMMEAGKNMEEGDSGTAVTQMKTYLAAAGYAVGSSGSTFDSTMKTKVKAFQTAFGLEVDGVVGINSWNMAKKYYESYTNPVASNTGANLRYGPSAAISDAVKEYQENLKTMGYSIGSVDGIFGANTLKATLLLQLQHSLDVDGIAGSKTKSKAETIASYTGNRLNYGKPYTGFSCLAKKSSMNEAEAVIRCCYGEAKSIAGMQAVAQVIANRVLSGEYPDAAKEVVFQSNQFSCMDNVNDTNVSPDRSSTKWGNALTVVGSTVNSFNAGKTYHATLKNVDCVRFRTAASGDSSGNNSLVVDGNYFFW